ncbi:MAG: NAD(+) synthase [Acidobacteria bacterium]|nr:MAG: NAD(+) synthase [Acidobacteriota bacterium]
MPTSIRPLQGVLPFRNLYRHGFVRAAVGIPTIRGTEPEHNADQVLELAREADHEGCALAVFPELVLSGYSCDDLFHQDALLEGCERELLRLRDESAELRPLLLVGLPLRVGDQTINAVAALHRGAVLGVAVKSYLPNYREYYEQRFFAHAPELREEWVEIGGESVPVGADLLFAADDVPGLVVHVEICEDLWAPLSPHSYAALAGATVLCNASASNVTIGKLAYRRMLCLNASAKSAAAYLYAGAGYGESTTDLAWDGHGIVAENGDLLAESQRFSPHSQLLVEDIDLDRLLHERIRWSTFHDAVERNRQRLRAFRSVGFTVDPPSGELPLQREIERFPYVPADPLELDERCEEAYQIQVQGLARRMEATGIERPVIGISGGLDSTHALIVTVQAMERLGLPRENVYAVTMPGFATSERTLGNAYALMEALGLEAREIDIRPSCRQMLADIGHPYADGEPVYDTTFENVQAGERTSHLFRIANQIGGLVVGTGDLSELALGWTTYGVGDQMSHYGVNSSVPKTLIQHLIRWVADSDLLGPGLADVLRSILDTEISPELVPHEGHGHEDAAADQPAQRTEEIIGPYELQDFNLYYTSRYGYRPSKVAFMSEHAWSDIKRGHWPAGIDELERRSYELREIRHWLRVFLQRFFAFSQFKRSALPNGPKVGSGGSLSPRGDWRAPSDASARAWLDELDRNVPDS